MASSKYMKLAQRPSCLVLALIISVCLMGCESRQNDGREITQASLITVENVQEVIEGNSQGLEKYFPANLQTTPSLKLADSRDGYIFSLRWDYGQPQLSDTVSWWMVNWYVEVLVSPSGNGNDFQPLTPGTAPYNFRGDEEHFFYTAKPLERKLYQFRFLVLVNASDSTLSGPYGLFHSYVLLRRFTVDLRNIQN